jgi:probable H4MPT-linked C1 transfer pathway protein
MDIGGANLKTAHSSGQVIHRPFELWKNPSQLPRILESVLGDLPAFDACAVTMTAELCDCFATRRQGVHFILDAVAQVAGSRPVWVWRTDGRFVDLPTARAEPLLAAAANWLALATFAGRFVPSGPGLLLDVGSTTTDLVPLWNGTPIPQGRTDLERLRCRELVYTGARRTPLCALLGSAGAAEWFATTLDVYLLLGQIPEEPGNGATADGRPATRNAAHGRLARMVCADAETFAVQEATSLAQSLCNQQIQLIRGALWEIGKRAGWIEKRGKGTVKQGAPLLFPACQATVVLAGSGEFLARMALADTAGFPNLRLISLADALRQDVSEAACAYAVARLAAETL